MKKIVILLILCVKFIPINAQIRTCVYYDGYWGEWEDQWLPSLFSSTPQEFFYKLYGNESGFLVYHVNEHPSRYVFKFQINNYVAPTKQQIKEHNKRQEWYEYTGTAEYFVIEDRPTIKDILKEFEFPLYHKDVHDNYGNYAVKRVANATIKIAPYKKTPSLYNIWFDDVAIAIELVYVHFSK